MGESVLVTGAAGFIGFHLARRLLEQGQSVVGMDNMNAYYDPGLKEARLAVLSDQPRFAFQRLDLIDEAGVDRLFSDHRPSVVVHLAAQAGVRYSLENPRAYVDSNVVGFLNILEACRAKPVRHLVYASSSSVYGANSKLPFSVGDDVDRPVSLYAATKKADELMAYTYSHLYGIPTTGLRFFTVYGPWGRPDMAAFKFTEAILSDQPIDVYNFGEMKRDFTYIDDIVEGVVRVMDRPPTVSPPYRLYNIGNHEPVGLLDFIAELERALGRKAKLNLRPMQPGDVLETYAATDDLRRDTGFAPSTPLSEGLVRFVDWYRGYFRT
ncbi:MAG TPA: NAD-dependent epimerase [Fimbriimonadaceae bacterium]|nr:NAD-dependent epimerase [Fimbriimonadaceae bacterium]HRJ95931.1 NAD-dependent epimerase [Fimbriimonadaceae bacterium]